jgi:DNA-binding NarL/FixJ family response regulator
MLSVNCEGIMITSSQNDCKIRLILAEDHAVLRKGMAKLFGQEHDFEVVGEAPDGESAVSLALELRPDVVLMDLELPKMSGIEATRVIHGALPETKIIGLSMYDEKERSEEMFSAGASLYLNKTSPAQELIAAIRACSGKKTSGLKAGIALK